MSIDWLTFFAQLFNFVLLVWLLNRYLFKPILKVVEERSLKIRNEIEKAAMREEDALKEKKLLAEEREEFEKERARLLSQAVAEAQREKERLITSAKEKERERACSELRKNIEDEIIGLTRKALEEVAHSSLEAQIAEVFIQKMGTMDAETRKALLADTARGSHAVSVKSAFDLPSSVRMYLEKNLREILGHEITCTFEKNPSVMCGIEMVTANRKVEWNFSQYLSSFRTTL
jgi:F-type H+-transporting ATPase subunit b